MSGRIIDVTLTAEARRKLTIEDEATIRESGMPEHLFKNAAGRVAHARPFSNGRRAARFRSILMFRQAGSFRRRPSGTPDLPDDLRY
jgi:hypothetical protein